MSEVENFCQYMCQIIHQCAFGNATILGNSQIKPFSASGGIAPRPLLPDPPIISVSGPAITMLLVTPLPSIFCLDVLEITTYRGYFQLSKTI